MRRVRWAGLAVVLAVLAGSAWVLFRNPFSAPEAALAAFYGGEPRHGCQLADPLRRAGKSVVPLIIAELPNRSMRRRRSAISFLGEGGYRDAVPALELIAKGGTGVGLLQRRCSPGDLQHRSRTCAPDCC
jgi:hypothetical protein